ncbi:MAG: FixH family protein [Chitinophagales bacterium]|jgi:hypothetical protein|nr:FixH family protein [Chitinophagales bacterium]
MKMNWGNKLVLVFIGFALLMGTLVYKAVNTNFELVSKDYYKEELRYQEKIDGKQNASAISKISINQNADYVLIQYPKELQGQPLKGEVYFYCPTNSKLDYRTAVQTDANGVQQISKKDVANTRFVVKINWASGDKAYYMEENLAVE